MYKLTSVVVLASIIAASSTVVLASIIVLIRINSCSVVNLIPTGVLASILTLIPVVVMTINGRNIWTAMVVLASVVVLT